MKRKFLLTVLIVSICFGNTDLNSLLLVTRTCKNSLRPAATAGDKDLKLELQLLSKALTHYPPKFWLDFLKGRRNYIDEKTAETISRQAGPLYPERPEAAYPILEPNKKYSLRRLIEIRDNYFGRRKRLNVVEYMELYFIDKIVWERIRFFYGERRGRVKIPLVPYKRTFDSAFKEIEPKHIRVILNNRGKIIYFSEKSHIAFIIDIGGNYFRVLDMRLQPFHIKADKWCYVCPGEDMQYKGPYLDKFLHRIPLLKWSRKSRRHYPVSDEDYKQMTHFKIEGKSPYPMKPFSKKGVLTLLETYHILEHKLGIEDVQICFSTELQERSVLRADDWYIEISKEDKKAMVYVRREQFSFVQHFYTLRDILQKMGLQKAELSTSSEGQARVDIPNAFSSFQERITTLTAIDGAA